MECSQAPPYRCEPDSEYRPHEAREAHAARRSTVDESEDESEAHLLADSVDDGLDLGLERGELAVTRLAHLAIRVLLVTLHRDAAVGE